MTLYAYTNRNGDIVEETVSVDPDLSYDALWERMTVRFKRRYWKRIADARAGFAKLGYRLVKVRAIVTVEGKKP